MAKFSKQSLNRLASCHKKLQELLKETVKEINCAVICGHRGRYEQEKAFRDGKSRAKFGQSKHNMLPSLAVDAVPIPLDWNDIESFEKLGSVIMRKAEEMNIKIRWGRDFKNLKDYPHYELMEE
ncbi:MAG: M15 family metallopeptidase [Mucispirillum sp.]|nr:M15 family metallopeptidase [Mucispirillum sp.]